MLTSLDKALVALLPLVTMLGNFIGFDVTPEWWTAVVAVITPIGVYWIANK